MDFSKKNIEFLQEIGDLCRNENMGKDGISYFGMYAIQMGHNAKKWKVRS